MDAGEWTEAEPEQDGGFEGGCPSYQWFGKFLSFGGATLTTKSVVHSLEVHLDPVLTMEIQVASVVRTAYFHI